MTEHIDFDAMNREVIRQFHETGGKADGAFAGKPLVLVHHIGAKSGVERDEVYARQSAVEPQFADYQRRMNRLIPVVELVRDS